MTQSPRCCQRKCAGTVHRPGGRRRGTAAVEFAVCLPTIVLLVFASIESCSMIFLKQTLAISAYEGVRVAIKSDATNEAVTARCEKLLSARRVNKATISLNPTDISKVAGGETITVSVAAPCDANAMIPSWFFGGRTLDGEITMVKE